MSEEEHSAESGLLPCCNVIEPDGAPCPGFMRPGWPEFVCNACLSRCGALVHRTHVIPPGERVKPKGECPGCHAMPFGKHSPDCTYVVEDEN